MPAINLETLSHLNVRSAADLKQPSGSSECGAYAVAASVGAFGVSMNEGSLHYAATGPEVIDRTEQLPGVRRPGASDFQQRCSAIYGVTGILNSKIDRKKGRPDPELIQDKEHEDLGNSPAAMAQAIRDINKASPEVDLAVPQIYALPMAIKNLLYLYPGAQERCIDAVGEQNVHPKEKAYSPPVEGTTQALLVQRNENGPMHWLAQGDDRKFYDPAKGTVGNGWSSPRSFHDNVGDEFKFLGLWITIASAR